LKVGLCDFLLVINNNLDPISHRLATMHPRRTERRTDRLRQPWQQLDRYL